MRPTLNEPSALLACLKRRLISFHRLTFLQRNRPARPSPADRVIKQFPCSRQLLQSDIFRASGAFPCACIRRTISGEFACISHLADRFKPASAKSLFGAPENARHGAAQIAPSKSYQNLLPRKNRQHPQKIPPQASASPTTSNILAVAVARSVETPSAPDFQHPALMALSLFRPPFQRFRNCSAIRHHRTGAASHQQRHMVRVENGAPPQPSGTSHNPSRTIAFHTAAVATAPEARAFTADPAIGKESSPGGAAAQSSQRPNCCAVTRLRLGRKKVKSIFCTGQTS